MSYLAGLMYLDDDEIFNNGRTLANIQAARTAGTLPVNIHFENEAECDCAAYDLNPTLYTGTFEDLIACMPTCFNDAENFNCVPAANPWHDDDDATSDEFLGVWVNSVDGMDGRHNSRNATPRGAYPRGSILSPLTPTHRTISYDITLVATSDCGLDYGMQWLEQQLAGANCQGCDLQTMTIRTCCPPVDDPEYGIWQFKEVGLGDGPEWQPPLDSRLAMYFRDAHLAFFAGNPCRFGKPEEITAWHAQWLGNDFFSDSASAYVLCGAVPAATKTYSYAPIITLRTNANGPSFPFVIFAVENPSTSAPCTYASTIISNYVNDTILPDNPAFQLGVLSVPADSTLVIDAALREIRYSGPATDYEEIDGSQFIDASVGAVRWTDLACGSELALNLSVDGDGLADAFIAYALEGFPGPSSSNFYSPPSIRADIVKRGGC